MPWLVDIAVQDDECYKYAGKFTVTVIKLLFMMRKC